MSTLRPQRNARKIRHFRRHQPSFPAPCCLCVHGFRFSRVKEHYVVSTRAACQTRTRHGWHSPRQGPIWSCPALRPTSIQAPTGTGRMAASARFIRVSPMPPMVTHAPWPLEAHKVTPRSPHPEATAAARRRRKDQSWRLVFLADEGRAGSPGQSVLRLASLEAPTTQLHCCERCPRPQRTVPFGVTKTPLRAGSQLIIRQQLLPG